MINEKEQEKNERHVLYGITTHIDFIEKLISEGIKPECFTEPNHRMFFVTVINYYNAFKALLTREVLERKLRFQKVSEDEISNHLIVFDTISGSETNEQNFSFYISELRREFDERELKKFVKQCVNGFAAGENVYTIREKLANELNEMTSSESNARIEIHDLKASADIARKELKERHDHPEKFWGIQCHIPEIDKPIQGFVPGRMIIIAGEPGGYKSTTAINIGYRIAKYSKAPVTLISLEMSYIDILIKMIAMEARVSSSKLFGGDIENLIGKIDEAVEKWKKMDDGLFKIIDIAQMGKTSIGRILSEVTKICKYSRPKVVIVDYLSLIGADIPNPKRPDLELGDICKALRGAARKYKFSLVVLCQMKREAIERMRKQSSQSGQTTTLGGEDIGGSQEIANDADAIFFLTYDRSDDTKLKVIMGKNRFGPKDNFKLLINKDESYIGSIHEEDTAKDMSHDIVDNSSISKEIDLAISGDTESDINNADATIGKQNKESEKPKEPVKKEEKNSPVESKPLKITDGLDFL